MKISRLYGITVLFVLAVSTTFNVVSAQAQKNYGGTLVAHVYDEGPRLQQNYDFTDFYPAWTMFSKLIAYNAITWEPIPDIAERWEISPDAKVYTFYLAKNVEFHDGHKCTSADVKWTYESVIKEKGYWVTQLSSIDKIEAPDDYTIKITLKQPDASFLGALSSYYSPHILPKHLYDGTDVRKNEYNRKPIGTGPYKFVEWIEGSHITVVRNEKYFKFRPYLDKMIIKISQTWSVVLSALESGEIQFSYMNPPYKEAVRLSKLPNLAIGKVTWPIIMHLDLNLKRKPFDDVRVRQAIASALDLNDMNEKVYAGINRPLQQMYLSEVKWAFNSDAKQPAYNPSKAEQLLDEVGLKKGADGIRFKTTVTTFTTMGSAELGEVIREHLRKIGVDAKVEPLEWGLYTEKILTKRDFDMVIGGGLHGPEPDSLAFFVKSDGYRNTMSYNNSKVDQLFTRGRQTSSLEERGKIYKEMQAILAQDLPRISLMEFVWVYPYRTDFQGFYFQPEYGSKQPQSTMEGVFWTKAAPATTTVATTTKPAEQAFPTATAALTAVVAIIAVAGAYVWSKKGKSKTSK